MRAHGAVALVLSGDPGIYAMASLVFERLDAGDLPDGAHRAEIVVERKAGRVSVLDECEIDISYYGGGPYVKASVYFRYKRRYGKAPG